jgi:hypothetical protein
MVEPRYINACLELRSSIELLLDDRRDRASPQESGVSSGWRCLPGRAHLRPVAMEMMSVKEQKITAATARLKDESDYRTIVLKIKTPPRYPRVVA